MAEQATPPQASPATPPAQAPAASPAPQAAAPEQHSREELARAAKVLADERKRIAAERAELDGWKKQRDEAEAVRKDRLRNPDKYLKSEYGDDWYDKLTKYKLQGIAPTDLAANVLAEAEQKFAKTVEPLQKKLESLEAEKQRAEEAAHFESIVETVKAAGEKYRYINGLKQHDALAQVIRAHWDATATKDEDGNVKGELLTAEQAADLLESRFVEMKKLFDAVPAPKPAATPKPNEPQQRSLSTDPQPQEQPSDPLDDRERMRRAIAAMEEAQKKRAPATA